MTWAEKGAKSSYRTVWHLMAFWLKLIEMSNLSNYPSITIPALHPTVVTRVCQSLSPAEIRGIQPGHVTSPTHSHSVSTWTCMISVSGRKQNHTGFVSIVCVCTKPHRQWRSQTLEINHWTPLEICFSGAKADELDSCLSLIPFQSPVISMQSSWMIVWDLWQNGLRAMSKVTV